MINTQRVNETLCAISGLSEAEVGALSLLVQNSVNLVSNTLYSAAYEDDDRVVFLAAARAYYTLMMTKGGAGNVKDFTAGDVKISLATQSVDEAHRLYQTAAEAASGLVRDNGFVFRGV